MPILDASWPGRLRIIGDLERPDHWYLTEDDQCAFFGEYTARAGFGHSSTNQLIHNLKKSPSLRGTQQWKWRGAAIRDVGQAIARNLTAEGLTSAAFVPIPPSKPPNHPEYDDRMTQVARAIGPNVDVREVLFATAARDPAHINQSHRDLDALRASLALRPELIANAPTSVILLDDVLTTGCSFSVCKAMLTEVWPDASIFGLFVARRAIDHLTGFDGVTEIDVS